MSFLKKMISIAILAMPASLMLAPACTQAEQLCSVQCDCVLCNDREEDECVIQQGAEVDRAAAYDCVEDFDKYVECVIDDSDCDDNAFDVSDCGEDYVDYQKCVADNSDYGN